MLLSQSSLTVVLLGDWNKLYSQPKWIAENVYCQTEIDLGVIGQGTDYSVTYRCNNIIITPSQSQVTFVAINMNKTTIESLISCINNFLQKAYTPVLSAYGFNCEFTEVNCKQFVDIIDNISDNGMIIQNGYEILNTKISRTLSKDGLTLNFESSQNEDKTIMHFNEHHGTPLTIMPKITVEMIEGFLSAANGLIVSLGYDIEEAE